MKRLICAFLTFALLLCGTLKVFSVEDISAEAAVLYCPQNRELIYAENENLRMRPASTTKIMTALLALEYAEKNDKKVRFTEEMTAEGSSMYLKIGEVLRLSDLAKGLLMCSGNDAANAVAIAVAGSQEKFARLMNRRAAKIGMKHTHFVTPSGLDDENHYTTASDMALLMAEALKNRAFKKLTREKSAQVDFIKPSSKRAAYSNHNRLLSLYRYCIGGKTGYTTAAGRCLVTAAEKDGLRLIAVTLNDRNDWNDHIKLYDKGFKSRRFAKLDDSELLLDIDAVGGDTDKITAGCAEISGLVLKKGDRLRRVIYAENFLYSPVEPGASVGKIVYTVNGRIAVTHTIRAY